MCFGIIRSRAESEWWTDVPTQSQAVSFTQCCGPAPGLFNLYDFGSSLVKRSRSWVDQRRSHASLKVVDDPSTFPNIIYILSYCAPKQCRSCCKHCATIYKLAILDVVRVLL